MVRHRGLSAGKLEISGQEPGVGIGSPPMVADFPGLKVEQRDGFLVVPWHGREDGERGKSFAARIQAETGCLINGPAMG
jgi:hypothetical protein